MTVTLLWVHPRGDRKTRIDLTALPGGVDLLHAFYGFIGEVLPEQLLKKETESFAQVDGTEPRGRTLGMSIAVGRFGEEGVITNVTSMIETGKFTKEDATSVVTHGLMVLPKGSTDALVFMERSAGQSGISRVLELFKSRFDLAYPEHLLETESVVESEAWLKSASLVRVSANVYKKKHDLADNDPAEIKEKSVGELAHTLVPGRGNRSLPRRFYDGLISGTIKPGELLSFNDEEVADEVEVTLENNGQRKTFIIGREKRPSISYPLTGHGDDALDLSQVRDAALNHTEDLLKRRGIDWSEINAQGRWSESELQVKLVIKNGEQA